MLPALKSSTLSGKRRKRFNRYLALRLYLIFGIIFLLLFFGVYTHVLIQNAKRDAQYVPRLFAQYIAYTDDYLKKAEMNTQLLTEVLVEYLQAAGANNYQERMWNYLNTTFLAQLNIPIIITDADDIPTNWYHMNVPDNLTYDQLSRNEQNYLLKQLDLMISIPITYRDKILGYAHFQRPVSMQQFIKNIDYSIIITDRRKTPLYWRNVEIPENKVYRDLNLDERLELFHRSQAMIEIPITNEEDSLGYAYFTPSVSLARIPYLVYFELVMMVLVVLFGLYGLMLLKRTEKDSLWIGLAKETAHQFGTPVTSLMGWVDYLKAHPRGFKSEEEYSQFIEWMTADLEKLKTIASRFGKVGSTIKLMPHDLDKILQEIVEYFKDRLPHQSSKITITYISKISNVKVMMDADLIKWTMENLIKNCIDAIGKKGGNIIITASVKQPWVFIHVMDEGKGIPRSLWKKIFEPGTTTKNRGWGLGLSLAKRIIDEYHQGKIKVLTSAPGEGTTIEIALHATKPEA
ncbi:MAG: HAMP domain-containing sensor histidine kinase [Candidatus Cloacimonadaceae bacterium]